MNQKSSLREDPQFVSWVLTGNSAAAIVGEDEVKRNGAPSISAVE
jgi:hypothetical protein